MKNFILTAILVVSITCLFAQNHRHNTPYKSESSRIIRMDTSIYEETTTVFVEGLSTTNKVEAKALYTIPKHLRKLDTKIIDGIVRENTSFTTIKWSWFIIWERTYTKDDVYQQFSWKAVENLLIVYGIMAILLMILASLIERSVKKGIKQLMKVNSSKDLDKEDWGVVGFAYGAIISVMSFIITGIQNNTADLDVWFGFMIYHVIVIFVFYLVLAILRWILGRWKIL